MKNKFKLILYIIPLFVCLSFGFPCFASNNGLAWGSDVLTGSNGSVNINSLLGDTYSFESLFSPGFVVSISNAYDELNNQLYDRFGWDLDDAGQKIIDISGGELGITLNTLAKTINNPATDILAGGYNVFQFVRSGGGKSLVLGLQDVANNTIDKIKGTTLNYLAHNDIINISSAVDDLVDSGDIVDLSALNIPYGKNFSLKVNNWGSNQETITLHLSLNYDSYLFYRTLNDRNYVGFSKLSDNNTLTCSGIAIDSNGNTSQITCTLTQNNPNPFGFTLDGVQYDGFRIYNLVAFGWSATPSIDITDMLAVNDFVLDPVSVNNARSYNWANSLSRNQVMELLGSLEGHWVSTEDMTSVRDLLDGGVITRDNDGELVYDYDDTIVDSLADIIDDLLEKSQAIEGELEGVIDDSGTADPDDDDPTDNTGISVPPDYPTSSFDTVNDVIRSPLEFFSIFEPIFMIFGNSALMIFTLWLFVPCIIIIAFLIWALK